MQDLSIFIVVGEHSGDALGARLMDGLTAAYHGQLSFAGVGGDLMAERGFKSIFPIADVAVMGPLAILPRLPKIIRRVHQTVDAALAASPDVVVIIDSPEFTHPIAKRIRKRRPDIPIVDYVSPSVWAWRPGRAKKMVGVVDQVLALFPFEPPYMEAVGIRCSVGYFRFGALRARWHSFTACCFPITGDFDVERCTCRVRVFAQRQSGCEW